MRDEMTQPIAAGVQVIAPQGFRGWLPFGSVEDAIEEVDVGDADFRRWRLTVSHSSAQDDRNGQPNHGAPRFHQHAPIIGQRVPLSRFRVGIQAQHGDAIRAKS